MTAPIAIAHLDESCLGNGKAGANPGGAGMIIELRHGGAIERRDVWVGERDTTNNRMALTSAIALLTTLAAKGNRFRLLGVSDSEYLVKGIREWLPGWVAKGWRRKAGPIENLELWQELHRALRLHDANWGWVRGHQGHPKNEYANDLAVRAAREQTRSEGAAASGFDAWLAAERRKKKYLSYDPDAAFGKLEALVESGRGVPLRLEE
ncbi:MAG TPA: ribonuclease H [Gemmatimonadales bacterium]|nr:ribonuclease H [Gemmatimonadales bacterium]